MSNSILLLICILTATAISFLLLHLFRKFRSKSSYQENNELQSEQGFRKKNTLQSIKLSVEEKIALSWKFLYELTETILNKFSQEDKNIINEAGKVLYRNGMKYIHVVDTNQSLENQQAKSLDIEKHKHGSSVQK